MKGSCLLLIVVTVRKRVFFTALSRSLHHNRKMSAKRNKLEIFSELMKQPAAIIKEVT